jgi:mannose-6-phosphate isomerase-like protein (cupin superfamily)
MAARAAKVVQAGEGRAFWLVTDHVTIKVAGEETDGAYVLAEVVVPPDGGPPPHVHHREDECFTILEGEFEFLAGDRTVRAGAGAVVFGPRGVPHTFKNVGSAPGRMILVASPAGFERFVADAGVAVAESPRPPAGPPDVEALTAVAAKYGIELVV